MNTEESKAEPLGYAPSPNTVSVRGFRLLIALTLLNTVLLGGYVLGPAFNAYARQQWAAYQQRKADERAAAAEAAKRQAMMVAEKAAMTYAAEPDTLVYDDDPARRDPPTAGPAKAPAAPWPAVVPQPAAYQGLPRKFQKPSYTVLFLHERRASVSSPPRLVLVVCDPEFVLAKPTDNYFATRRFWIYVFRPTTQTDEFGVVASTPFVWSPAGMVRGQNVNAALTPMRVFAGEADADDPSRLIIPYDLNGVGGMIRGQLQSR